MNQQINYTQSKYSRNNNFIFSRILQRRCLRDWKAFIIEQKLLQEKEERRGVLRAKVNTWLDDFRSVSKLGRECFIILNQKRKTEEKLS